MSKTVIIIAVAVVALAGASAFVALRVLSVPTQAAGQSHATDIPKVAYVEIREMTLRLADAGSEHYIKIDPVMAVRAKEERAVADKIPVVRDRIVTVVTARSSNELSSPTGQRKLKEDLVAVLRKDFQDTLVDIYFSDYLVE